MQELSSVDEMTSGIYPKELDHNILLSDKTDPTFIAIGNTQNGWTSVQLNSFKKLHNWAQKISKELNTTFIHIIGQTASDVYYFLVYERGLLRREIEIYYGDLDNTTDKGEKFSFEKPSLIPASDEDYENIFDRDTLEQYCKAFGFDLFYQDEYDSYYILRKKVLGKTIREYAASYNKPKPWWRFW